MVGQEIPEDLQQAAEALCTPRTQPVTNEYLAARFAFQKVARQHGAELAQKALTTATARAARKPARG